MIEFPKYAKIKDNYCICYFGNSDEYLVQLRLLAPIIQKHFPKIKLWFGCRDDKTHLLHDLNVMKVSEIKVKRLEMGHIKELKFNGKTHPIEDFLSESEIREYKIQTPSAEPTTKCVLITHGNYPTKPLSQNETQNLRNQFQKRGYDVEVDTDISNSGLVVGVESVALFEAASRGIEVKLIPTGIGAQLAKTMFGSLSLLHI